MYEERKNKCSSIQNTYNILHKNSEEEKKVVGLILQKKSNASILQLWFDFRKKSFFGISLQVEK